MGGATDVVQHPSVQDSPNPENDLAPNVSSAKEERPWAGATHGEQVIAGSQAWVCEPLTHINSCPSSTHSPPGAPPLPPLRVKAKVLPAKSMHICHVQSIGKPSRLFLLNLPRILPSLPSSASTLLLSIHHHRSSGSPGSSSLSLQIKIQEATLI